MGHPYSNAAGYIYANEYQAPFDSGHWNSNTNDRSSVGKSHYDCCNRAAKRLEVDFRGVDATCDRRNLDRRNLDRCDVVRPGKKMARALRPGMSSTATTSMTKPSSTFSPLSRVFPSPSRTTSNHSHVNPILAVKHPRPKHVPTSYDPFAYHPGVYDTQDFIHTDDNPPQPKSKFPFKFKLTLPNPFQFRNRPRSPTTSFWPPDSSLCNNPVPSRSEARTTTNNPACPLYGRAATECDDDDDDPSSSQWRWSSFESQKPSPFKLTRWFSKTKSKTCMESVALPRPSTYHAPSRNFLQERHTLPKKKSSGSLHPNTTREKQTRGSLRSAQDAVKNRLGPSTGRRAEKGLKFSMVVTP